MEGGGLRRWEVLTSAFISLGHFPDSPLPNFNKPTFKLTEVEWAFLPHHQRAWTRPNDAMR